MRNIIIFVVLLLFSVPILFGSLDSWIKKNREESGYKYSIGGVGFETTEKVILVRGGDFQKIKKLTRIVEAISEYENRNYSFPKSAEGGTKWSSPVKHGDNWIEGIAPDYIESIPYNTSKKNGYYNNFLYRSNGVDFKLIAHGPEDCSLVKEKYSQIIDPVRGCNAYGYWTKSAKDW